MTESTTPTETLTGIDKTVADRAAAIQKQIDDDYGAVFAKTLYELNGAKAPNGKRDGETNLGDLITDALVWGAKQNGETVDAALPTAAASAPPSRPGTSPRRTSTPSCPSATPLASSRSPARSCWRRWRHHLLHAGRAGAASRRSAVFSSPLTPARAMTPVLCIPTPPITPPRASTGSPSSP